MGTAMYTGARSRRHLHLALGTLVVLAACATVPELAAPPPPAATAGLEPELAGAPTPEPEAAPVMPAAPTVEESDAGDGTSFQRSAETLPTPALAALGTPATPVPDVLASAHLPAARTQAPSIESESLLTHIGPTTQPNVAAAMRLIEDGRQQLEQGRYDQALERFERGVAIDPTNAYGYYYLAQLYSLMKKYDQASAFAGRAATLAARSDRALQARAYGLQGAVFEEVGRYADARTAYQKAVQADPNNGAARGGVARLGTGR